MDLNILKHSLFSSLGSLNISVCRIQFQCLSLLLNHFYLFFLIKIFSSFTSSLSVRYSYIHFWNGLFFWFSYFLIYLPHLSLLILFYFILSWVIFWMPLTSFWHGVLSITYPLEEGVIQGSFCRLKNSLSSVVLTWASKTWSPVCSEFPASLPFHSFSSFSLLSLVF